MRILIYGLNFSPELTGIGKYTGELAAWLADRGHEVRVVAAPPYYPAWRVHSEYSSWLYKVENPTPMLRILRCPLWVPKKPTGITRILHLISFAITSFPMALLNVNWTPDVVFTVEPTFFTAPLAWVVAKISHAASWLHVQDFEVDAAFEMSFLPPRGPVHWFTVRAEEWFMSHFQLVSSISQKMVQKSISKGVAPEKAALFVNWVDVETIYPLSGPNHYRSELGLEDKVVVLYSGNMGGKQGLEMLAPLARACADDPRLQFVFCGNGSYRTTLEMEVATLPNVILLPLQPMEQLNSFLNMADIHLLPQRADASDLVMPSKLGGMLASGRPTIATADEGTQVALMLKDCGLIVPPADGDALERAVRTLASDPELRERLGRQSRAYAEATLERDRVLEQFESDMIRLAVQRRLRRERRKLAR